MIVEWQSVDTVVEACNEFGIVLKTGTRQTNRALFDNVVYLAVALPAICKCMGADTLMVVTRVKVDKYAIDCQRGACDAVYQRTNCM